MLQSNREIAGVLKQYNVSAATDVTGFGLIGHLLEMLSTSELQAELRLEDVPLLAGALELSGAEFRSTLYPQLQPYLLQCDIKAGLDDKQVDILLDPQTSGGLLLALPAHEARRLTQDFPAVVVIGQIESAQSGSAATAGKRIRIC